MRDVAQSWRSVARDTPVTYEMASPINRQLSGPITITLPLHVSCIDAKAEEPS